MHMEGMQSHKCSIKQSLYLELQSVMAPYCPWGSHARLGGIRSAPIPPKPPELLPQVVHTLTEIHLQNEMHSVSIYTSAIHGEEARLVCPSVETA